MAEFLSPEWIAELDRVARGTPPVAALAHARLTIAHVVRVGARGEVRYAVTIDRGRLRVSADAPADADLTVITDVETARALHRGTANAQDALAAGTLKVRGDLHLVSGLDDALAQLDDVFAEVRSTTTGV